MAHVVGVEGVDGLRVCVCVCTCMCVCVCVHACVCVHGLHCTHTCISFEVDILSERMPTAETVKHTHQPPHNTQ